MNILEVGSGPGFITEQLLIDLPHSHITSLEIDDTLIQRAKQPLSNYSEVQLEFVQGSVYHTGLPDNSYDFVIARMLFLLLQNPIEASKELLRVLKPGGKLVIIDIDDGLWGAIEPEIKELPQVLKIFAELQKLGGGNRYIGRSLLKILKESGYENLDMEAIVKHSELLGMDIFKPQFDVKRLNGLYKKGIIDKELYDRFQEVYDNVFQSKNSCAMLIFIMACGTKPNSQHSYFA